MSSIDAQLKNVNRAILRQISKASYRVVVSIALLIANRSIPRAPVDTGHLRNSSVILASRGGTATYTQKKYKVIRKWDKQYEELSMGQLSSFVNKTEYPQAVVAFIASYALQVHEGDPSLNWNDGGPKYLEKGVNESIPLIPQVAKGALTSKGKIGSLGENSDTALGSGTGDIT